ncbi:MAG: hypothetical protein WBR18_09460 [Anaerolineales bacterium]
MIRVPTLPYADEDRKDLLTTMSELGEQIEDVQRRLEEDYQSAEMLSEEDDLAEEQMGLRAQYAHSTPVVDVSATRSPACG